MVLYSAMLNAQVRLKHVGSLALSLMLWLAACGPTTATSAPRTLTVFAAASLTGAFTELGQQFEAANPGVTVVFNFGASNALAEQINQGAPADVLASANQAQMEAAIAGGRIDAGTVAVFARNRLVVIFPAANPGGVKDLADLARPGLTLVLAAPEVPAGEYALDFLDKASQDPGFGAGFKEGVLGNVVSYEENVRAVLAKVALGEADAGVVYASDVAGAGAANVDRLDIPDALNTVATYPLAPLNDSAQPELARAFIELVLSAEGQAVMEGYGFMEGG
jgi:molybdate transport system substrate-binding protein